MRWFKRVAIGAAILVAVAAVGLTALVLLVDPNHYKGPVADAVKKRYDRTLRMDGDLRFSVFPNLGVEIEKLSLSEPRSTQIFAAVDTARVSVAVLPLLSGRIVVDRVKVVGLKANVVRYQNGKFNFENLLGPASQPPGGPGKGAMEAQGKPLLFDVAGIEFSGGELALRDYMKGTSMRVERLSATTGRVAPGVPFGFDLSARVLGQSPRVDATFQSQGTLTVDPQRQFFAVKGLDLKATGVLPPSIRATALTARGDVAYDGQRQAIDAAGVAVVFQGDVAGRRPLTGVDLRLEAPRLNAGLAEGRLQVEKLALSAQGRLGADPFELSLAAPAMDVSPQSARGEALTAQLNLSGTRNLNLRLALSGISGAADELAAARLGLEGEWKRGDRVVRLAVASPLEASLNRRKVSLPQWAGQVDIQDPALPAKQMSIPIKGSVRADFEKERAAARLDATLDGGEFSASADVAQFDEPRIVFSVAADTLDLDKLLPRVRAAGTGGAPGGGARPPADPAVDLSALEGITARGTVKIGDLVVRGVKAGNVSASVRVAKGRADVSGLKASLYGGSLAGSFFADAATNRIGLAPTLTNVSIQPLLSDLAGQDRLTGRGTVALNLTATGKTVAAMKRGLNGTASIALRDGAIKGVNIAASLYEFRSMLSLRKDEARPYQDALQTDFSDLQAQLVFAGGIGTVRSLSVRAPLLRIAEGDPARIDIPGQRLDLVALVTVVNTGAGQDGKELAALRNVTVPLHVGGSFDSPSYTIQWSKVAVDVLGVIKNKLKDGLDIERPESGDKLRDAVKDKLKGLFR